MNINLITIRLITISTIIVTVTDLLIYYHLKKNPDHLTLPFVFQVIAVTVIPIAINIWYHLRYK